MVKKALEIGLNDILAHSTQFLPYFGKILTVNLMAAALPTMGNFKILLSPGMRDIAYLNWELYV